MLIHIGYHKAGSTWLQMNLLSQPDQGFLPLCPADTARSSDKKPRYLARYFVYAERGGLLSPFEERSEEVRSQFKQIIGGGTTLVPTISSERLSGNPHASGFDARAVCDRIHAAFPDARILIVVREQVSAILSTYFQYLRSGGHRSLRHYLMTKYDGRRPGFSFDHFRYDKLINYYHNRFSSERVLVLPFELLELEPRSFVAGIADHVGIEISSALPFSVKENRGSPRLVEIKTRYLNLLKRSDSVNGYVMPSWRLNQNLIAAVRRGLSRCVGEHRERACVDGLLAECRDLCGDRFVESNRRTSALIGRELGADFGYM